MPGRRTPLDADPSDGGNSLDAGSTLETVAATSIPEEAIPMFPHLRRAVIAVAVCLLSSPLPSCQSASRGEPYAPGLGEIMSLTQMRHLKLWFAGRAENWALASYETDELEEGFSDVVRFHPTHKGSPAPLSQLVPEFTAGPIEELRQAIAGRDLVEFTAAYDSLTQGCNGCHRATEFSFNVVERPSENPYSNQRFQLHR